MKKLIVVLTLSGLFSCFENKAQDLVPKYGYDDLKPGQTQEKVEQFVTQFLSNYHYKKFQIDDSLSSKVWDKFLKEVDGSHAYFTESDIKSFEQYRYTIDEALLSGDLTAPYKVFNIYRKRYKERYDKVIQVLNQKFDFTAKESYNYDREKAPWAKSTEELDDVWRKIIKSQALDLKLSEKTDSAVVATLKKRYDMSETRMSKLRAEDVFQTFMNSFTETIDPHTNYMIPSTAAQFNIEMSQSLEGIGASLRNEGDFVTIVDIIPGGPLFRSKEASKMDKIVAVAQGEDGQFQDIVGWLTDDAVKLIRGKKGTTVRLKLLGGDAPISSQPKEIKLVREKIKLEEAVAKSSIDTVYQNKKMYRVGVIDIPMFYRDFEYARRGGDFQSTTKDVKRFLDEFNKQGVAGVVIDLRNNGGGSLTEAINLTGLFIPKGPVVQRRDSGGGVDVESDTDPETTYTGPLVILQNRFSASASEIFAGAIQDYKRGLILGEQSFGKGTVQQLVDLDQFLTSPRVANNGKVASTGGAAAGGVEQKEKFGQLKLTTEKFYRITGNSTQRKGVMPDVALPTPFDPEEMGESSEPSALPYDEVEGASFAKSNVIDEKLVSKLADKHRQRLTSDADLKTLAEDLAAYKKMKDVTVVSLNIDDRKKEREETEKRRKSINKLNNSKDKKDADIYLIQSERILADMITLKK